MEQLILTDNDLNLVITEKTLGKLKTNALQIKEIVERAMPNYDISNYTGDNIEQAKKDKALLNNAAKILNSKRIEIEKEWMKPFSEFKTIVADTVKLISECSDKIDSVVKQSEEKEKNEKRTEIQKYFDSKEFALVSLDRIFDTKWLNKTEKIKSVYCAIDEAIAKIQDDIKTLEAIGEDAELLKSLYLDTLNINTTIQYANTLKQNRERIKSASAPINQAQHPTAAPIEEVKEEKQATGKGENDTLLVRAFKVTASREKIIALGDYMNENGILFEKIELHENA